MPKGNEVLEKLQQVRVLVDECIAELDSGARHKAAKTVRPAHRRSEPVRNALDFDANERAFVKAYARGLSGPKKFVLLVAYLTKGKIGEDVELNEVERQWNRMTAPNLLDGKFNRFYTNAAKESGWINTKKKGLYFLQPSWTQVLKSS
jgi:hypothetical protein